MSHQIGKSKGIALMDVIIAMVVVAILYIALRPAIVSALLTSKVDAMVTHVQTFQNGMSSCRSRFNTYTKCTTTMLNDEGFVADKLIDNMATANPWGGSYAITPAAQSWTLVVAGMVSTEACNRGESTFTEMGGITASCAGTTLTLVFSS